MDRTRTGQMAQVARRLGMHFDMELPTDFLYIVEAFDLFSRGKNHRVRNVLHRPDAMMAYDLRVFDYTFVTGMGKSKRQHYQTVFYMESKQLALPKFLLKPETLGHRLTQWLNIQRDIDFETFPKFSKRYWLVGEDEDYIRLTMNESVLHYFSQETGWHVEGLGYYLVVYKPFTLLPPSKVQSFYERSMYLHELFRDA